MKRKIISVVGLILLFGYMGISAEKEFTYDGKGWDVVIGKDGLIKSLKIGENDFLRPFPDMKTATIIRIQGKKEVPFTKVVKNSDGSIDASNDYFKVKYIFHPDKLVVRFQNLLTKGRNKVEMMWRPAANVSRAVDGEDDTSVDTMKTWYNDMVDGRWLNGSGTVLTFGMKGYWTRIPYNVKGTPCFATVIYPGQKGEWVFRPETKPVPATALVFEVKGENLDFLAPGGRPVRFPCAAENLGPEKLDLKYQWRVLNYKDHQAVAEKKENFSLDGKSESIVPLTCKLDKPGVYRAELALFDGKKEIKKKIWNFCYDFTNWKPRCDKPTDFNDFWERTLAQLRKIPIDLKKQKISEDDKSTLYKINYAVLNGKRTSGWLRIPKGPADKKFPARLHCPPSGVNNIPPPRPSNAVEMSIAIHGFDIDKSDFPKKPPYPWPNGRYHNVGLADKDTYFYRNVFCRCVRAVDILLSMPEVDKDRIMVTGGSQGGGLSVTTAALQPAIKLCAPGFPGLCRIDWTIVNKVGSWPLSEKDLPKGQTMEQMLKTLSYFDVANFIGDVKCPIVGTLGWMDTVTAAGGQIAAFAQGDKENMSLYCAPWGRHGASGRTQQAFWRPQRHFLQGKAIKLEKTWEKIDKP